MYLKHPNFLLYYIQAWIEIVNVVASLSLVKFHVFIHFIAIIASQKHPTHEFDKKETNIGRAQIMIRLGISPLFLIIMLWHTGYMLNSNANNFVYCVHTMSIYSLYFMFYSFLRSLEQFSNLLFGQSKLSNNRLNISIELIATILPSKSYIRICYSND